MVWSSGRIGQTTTHDSWASILYIRNAVVVIFEYTSSATSAVFAVLCQCNDIGSWEIWSHILL